MQNSLYLITLLFVAGFTTAGGADARQRSELTPDPSPIDDPSYPSPINPFPPPNPAASSVTVYAVGNARLPGCLNSPGESSPMLWVAGSPIPLECQSGITGDAFSITANSSGQFFIAGYTMDYSLPYGAKMKGKLWVDGIATTLSCDPQPDAWGWTIDECRALDVALSPTGDRYVAGSVYSPQKAVRWVSEGVAEYVSTAFPAHGGTETIAHAIDDNSVYTIGGLRSDNRNVSDWSNIAPLYRSWLDINGQRIGISSGASPVQLSDIAVRDGIAYISGYSQSGNGYYWSVSTNGSPQIVQLEASSNSKDIKAHAIALGNNGTAQPDVYVAGEETILPSYIRYPRLWKNGVLQPTLTLPTDSYGDAYDVQVASNGDIYVGGTASITYPTANGNWASCWHATLWRNGVYELYSTDGTAPSSQCTSGSNSSAIRAIYLKEQVVPIPPPPCTGKFCIEPIDPPSCGGDCLPPLPPEELN